MSEKLPKRVILLGWVSFFADISSEMIYPLMPLFLVGILKSPSLTLGLIEGVAQAIVSMMSLVSGVTSDRTGKRVSFVRWGYGLPILGKILIALSGTWHLVLLGRSVDRFGKGLRGSPRDALIAEAIDKSRRGEAFGYHRMMDTAGAFLGVIIAATAIWLLRSKDTELVYRIIFGIAALLAFLSFLVTFFVDESHAVQKAEQTGNQNFSLSIKSLPRDYWITLSILTVFAFANSSDAFLLLRASDVGLSALQVVLIYALYNLTYSIFSYSAGKLSDRYGRWRMITIGWGIYSIVYAGVAITDQYFIWGLFTFYGLYMALTEGVSKALIIDSVPAEKKGTALGILYMALGFSALSSNIIAGFLWDSYGKSMPFWIGAVTSIAAIIIILVSGRLNKKFNSLPAL